MALFVLLNTSLDFYWLLPLCVFVILSLLFELTYTAKKTMLYWNLDTGVVAAGSEGTSMESNLTISKVYLLFGILYLKVKRQKGGSIKLYIFPDSTDPQSYRRLCVAARWVRLK